MNQVTEEIIRLRSEFYREYDLRNPREINRGFCTQFAEELEYALKDKGIAAEYLHSDWFNVLRPLQIHAWVRVGDRYYDAETPEGVDNWEDLPIFKRSHW